MAAALILDNMSILEPDSASSTGDQTPTGSSPQSDSPAPRLAAEPIVVPVYLQRLMADYARQLRRAQGQAEGEDANSTSATVTEAGRSSTGGTVAGSPHQRPTSPTSSGSTELSPISFGHGSSSSATLPPLAPLVLPKAALDRSILAAAALTASAGAAVGVAIQTTTNSTTSATPLSAYTPNRRLENVYSPPKEIAPEEDLLPPDNFAMVSSFIYRSSFPKKKNFPFLKSLGLKSVLTLILEDYPEANSEFLEKEGIKFFQFGIPGNKEPFVQIPEDKIVQALALMLDARNHPMLIHCNKGKHRTGCLIGCLRRVQQWSLTQIFAEYRLYSYPKSRSMDQQFIEAFDSLPEVWAEVDGRYLPSWALPSSTGM